MTPPIALYHYAKNFKKFLEIFNDRFLRKRKKPQIFWHLIPGLRLFPNMAPHSNDAPYCHLPSCKKLETFNDRFPRKCPKTLIFDT